MNQKPHLTTSLDKEISVSFTTIELGANEDLLADFIIVEHPGPIVVAIVINKQGLNFQVNCSGMGRTLVSSRVFFLLHSSRVKIIG